MAIHKEGNVYIIKTQQSPRGRSYITTSVRIPPTLHGEIIRKARKEAKSKNLVIIELLEKGLGNGQ